jgi:hypothetical protein
MAMPLFVITLAINLQGVAEAADAPGAPDGLCDYCQDYTDAATAKGDVRSSYRPGTGYVSDPQSETVAAIERRREERKLSAPRKQDAEGGEARN